MGKHADALNLQETARTVACLAFLAGPCMAAAASDADRTLPLKFLARAAGNAPISLTTW